MSDNGKYYILTSEGKFTDTNKNSGKINCYGKKTLIFNDINLMTPINSLLESKIFIKENYEILMAMTQLDIISQNIKSQQIDINKASFLDLFKDIKKRIIINQNLQVMLINYVDIILNKGVNYDVLLKHKDLLESVIIAFQIKIEQLIDNYVTSKNVTNENFSKNIYHTILKDILINYSKVCNVSVCASFEAELKPEDKIAYPNYIKTNFIKNISLNEEHTRVNLLNALLAKKNIETFTLDISHTKYSKNLIDYWHNNCLLSFNLILDFLLICNPKRKTNYHFKKEEGINFLKNKQVTLSALLIIDILCNWKIYSKLKEKGGLWHNEVKLEMFTNYGIEITGNIETERKYKNTVFDYVDMILSVLMYKYSDFEGIYLTNDRGIKLFNYWYNLEITDKISIKNSVEYGQYTKESLINQLTNINLYENKFLTIQNYESSENLLLLKKINTIENNQEKIYEIIRHYSIGEYNSINIIDLFFKQKYLLMDSLIKKTSHKLTFVEVLKRYHDYQLQTDKEQLDKLINQLMNLYHPFVRQYLTGEMNKKTILYGV